MLFRSFSSVQVQPIITRLTMPQCSFKSCKNNYRNQLIGRSVLFSFTIQSMVDVLNPELVWIEGRCYRVTDVATGRETSQEHDLYENEFSYGNLVNGEEDSEYEIIPISDDRYVTRFHVPTPYYGSIIGKKGGIRNKIEHETKTEIRIPKQGQSGDIVIFGPSEGNVKAARRRINLIVMSTRMKQRPTHFISIPMTSQDIIKSFEDFKTSVLKECASPGLDESVFIKSTKLHQTIGMMCLMDNEERLLASKLLTVAKDMIMSLLKPYMPLKLRLKGLSYMNDDPSQIEVLYGRLYEENAPAGLLQNLADTLVEHFYKTGFMKKEHGRDNVKLHVTLINVKYRSRGSSGTNVEGSSHNRRPRETFDGTQILNKYKDYDFGVIEVKEIHLSQRHCLDNDGYYKPTCVLTLKSN